jgi:tyrosyl-tRNA synthetase
MNIVDLLKKRGLINDVTSEDFKKKCENPIKVYIGFDPTADSLHLGNLLPIVVLRWFEKLGHTPVVILGGATGRIGDPSGKSLERPLLDFSVIQSNVERIRNQILYILKDPIVMNNDDWFVKYPVIDFLRDVGKHFRVNTMLTKESVKTRLDLQEGISFTEFSYQIIQAYDFYSLFIQHNVVAQCGGSEQWGNITAGIELIRKLTGKTAFGLTFPLLMRSDGKKFGKSESGAIWLAEDSLSSYDFYQHIVRTSDADVIKLMRMLTFMDLEEIDAYEHDMKTATYVPNTAQKRLAKEVTTLVRGEDGLKAAIRATKTIAPGHATELDEEILLEIKNNIPSIVLKKEDVIGKKIVDIAAISGLTSSKGEASRLIMQGGAYVNNNRVKDSAFVLSSEDILHGKYILLSGGKRKKVLIQIIS